MELGEIDVFEEKHWWRYTAFSVELVRRKLAPPIRWCGKVIASYDAPQLIVADLETGELFRVKAFHTVERLLQRQVILQRLRPRVRHFAMFVLQFSNYRRGTTPGVAELARWYADIYDMRSDNVRRYIPTLKEVGVLETEDLLGPLFQVSKVGKKTSEFLAEDFKSFVRISMMRARKEWLRQQRAEFVGETEPLFDAWRRQLSEPACEGLTLGMVVPLKHLERLMSGDRCQFDDVWQLDREPSCSSVAEVMEPEVFYSGPTARSFEAFA